jgi:hypothetical protein
MLSALIEFFSFETADKAEFSQVSFFFEHLVLQCSESIDDDTLSLI